jgi:hypothetical protein
MKLTTSKIITIIIGCMVAVCIGTFAPQCVSGKLEDDNFMISASRIVDDITTVNARSVNVTLPR